MRISAGHIRRVIFVLAALAWAGSWMMGAANAISDDAHLAAHEIERALHHDYDHDHDGDLGEAGVTPASGAPALPDHPPHDHFAAGEPLGGFQANLIQSPADTLKRLFFLPQTDAARTGSLSDLFRPPCL